MNPYVTPGIAITEEQIINIWSKHYGLTVAKIILKDRHDSIRIPRQILMYCLRNYTMLSLCEVGMRLNRDHGTVINAIRKVKDCYLNDRELRGRLNSLIDELNDLSGKIKLDRLVVEISRDDLFRLMPELTEDEKAESMGYLWHLYKKVV